MVLLGLQPGFAGIEGIEKSSHQILIFIVLKL